MNKTIIFVILIILLIGIPYINYKYEKFYNEVPKEINIEAVVISNVKKNEYYNSYQIKGKNSIFKNKKFILYTKENLEYGDKVEVSGEFSKPDGQRNYKGFNYKKYLKTQKIYGVIKAKKVITVSKNNLNFVLIFTNNIRNKIKKNIKKILPGETSTLLTGILLGEKTNLDDQITISEGLEKLSEDEKKIIKARYYEDMTQNEVAKKLAMTQVMVSRYEKKGLAKMQEYMRIY